MGMINDITTVISGSMGMDMKSMSIESNNGFSPETSILKSRIKGNWKKPLKSSKVLMEFQE
jgi:GTP pyrophosphokinase